MKKEVAEKNFKFVQDTINFVKSIELNFLVLAERLHKIQTEEMYLPNYDTFTDFLKEININNSVASRLIKIHTTFVENYGIKHQELLEVGGWSKIAEILPVATTKKKAELWLTYASVNPQSVLRQMIKEKILKKKPTLTCNDFYIIKICRDSGSKYVLADTRDKNYQYEKWHDSS